ncbi:MAG: hypothetical protein JSU61_06790, partial [Fidelibacterota bacterium]
ELLYTPGQKRKVDQLLKNMEELVPFYEEHFGPCQNDKLTITMCYSLGANVGGIATSNIIIGQGEMCGTSTLAHEFGHQWFGNAVNADENYEAWLNESFAEYASQMYLVKIQRMSADLGLVSEPRTFDLWSDLRTFRPEGLFRLLHDVLGDRGLPPIHQEGVALEWEDLENMMALAADAYVIYYEGANALKMLQAAVGDSLMQEIMLEYTRDYTWQTVTTDTFVALVGQRAGQRIADNFYQAITTSQRPDLKITDVDVKQAADDRWETTVRTQYQGRWLLPVDVQAITEAGDTVTEAGRWLDEQPDIQFITASPVIRVRLDPRGRMFDTQRANNRWPRRIQIQPLYGLPSWDLYKLYIRPRLKVDWRGDRRYGICLAGGLGGNFMPLAPAYFAHQIKLDLTYSPQVDDHPWGGQVIYRNPVRATSLNQWEVTASYEYPRNQQSLAWRGYLGKSKFYFHGGQAAYRQLTTRIIRTEYVEGAVDDAWAPGSDLALGIDLTYYKHIPNHLSIFQVSGLTGYTDVQDGDRLFHRLSSRIDQTYTFFKGLQIHLQMDGRFVWDTRPSHVLRSRLGRLPQLWNEQGGASTFRGRTDVDSEWWDSMVTGGVSLGWQPLFLDINHLEIYVNWAVVDDGNSPLFSRFGELFESSPVYTAFGLGWVARSVLHYGVYFPLWLSHPPDDEPNWKFRTMVQLELHF